MGSYKRALFRNEQKQLTKQSNKLCFASQQEMEKQIEERARRLAEAKFLATADFSFKVNYKIMEVAIQCAYRKTVKHLGPVRMNRFMENVEHYFHEIGSMFRHNSDSEIGRWCELNNVDGEYMFGIKKKYIDPIPIRDEEGRPIILMDMEEEDNEEDI